MTTEDGKLRLALAVYEGSHRLWPTINGLSRHGIGADRLGLVALDSTVDRLTSGSASEAAAAASAPAVASGLLSGLEAVPQGPDAAMILASPRLVDWWRAGVRLPVLWTEKGAGQSPRLASELAWWVALGATVLAVEPRTADELWLATRILLGHSSCPVETLELSPPPWPSRR